MSIHSKRKDFIIQEIWARLTMYNFAERIIQSLVIKQDNNRKWEYQVNFTMSFYICMDYFRHPDIHSPPELENLNF